MQRSGAANITACPDGGKLKFEVKIELKSRSLRQSFDRREHAAGGG
jgi:hypothetical protein